MSNNATDTSFASVVTRLILDSVYFVDERMIFASSNILRPVYELATHVCCSYIWTRCPSCSPPTLQLSVADFLPSPHTTPGNTWKHYARPTTQAAIRFLRHKYNMTLPFISYLLLCGTVIGRTRLASCKNPSTPFDALCSTLGLSGDLRHLISVRLCPWD